MTEDEFNKVKERIVAGVSRKVADDGKLVEMGWVATKAVLIHPEAGNDQVEDCRKFFYAGALHVFSSMLAILEDGEQETENDTRRMEKLHNELSEFGRTLEKEVRAKDYINKYHNLGDKP